MVSLQFLLLWLHPWSLTLATLKNEKREKKKRKDTQIQLVWIEWNEPEWTFQATVLYEICM